MVVTDSGIPAISLTDDEVAAVAVRAGGAWRGFLPTVATTDPADLLAGVERGFRSLAARRLLPSGDGVDGPAVALEAIRQATGGAPWVVAYAASTISLLVPKGTVVSVLAVRESSDYLIDVCLPAGIHDLVVKPRAEAQQFVLGLVATAAREFLGDHATVVVLSACRDEQLIFTIDPSEIQCAYLADGSAEPSEMKSCDDQFLAAAVTLP